MSPYENPTSGLPFAAPEARHYHGAEVCKHCGNDHRLPITGGAAHAVDQLRSDIHRLASYFPNAVVDADVSTWPEPAQEFVNGKPWLAGFPAHDFAVSGRRGRMLGVLEGLDQNGQPVTLRAMSGPPLVGGPVGQWCPPLVPSHMIPSFKHGPENFLSFKAQSPFQNLGECAGMRLLDAALKKHLSVVSFAEMWIGATLRRRTTAGMRAVTRTDGELQPSCDACQLLFKHVLCDL